MRTIRRAAYMIATFLLAHSIAGFPQEQNFAAPASNPTPKIYYTGQLDGFLGSPYRCSNLSVPACKKIVDDRADSLNNWKLKNGAILVGMGDNFGPDSLDDLDANSQYALTPMLQQRTQPAPSQNWAVQFMSEAYDAVVPGKEDFAYGVEYLRESATRGARVPLVANNLTIQPMSSPECLSYPAPAPTQPLEPNQVSNAIATPTGSGSTGGGSGSGSCTPAPSGPPTTKQPVLIWPDKNAVYPWTVAIAVSVRTGQIDAHKDALVCPGDLDPDKNPDFTPCVPWKQVSADNVFPSTNAAYTLQKPDNNEVSSTETLIYKLTDHGSIPVCQTGEIIFAPGAKQPDGSDENAFYPPGCEKARDMIDSASRKHLTFLFPGNSVKVCLSPSHGSRDAKKYQYVCIDSPVTVQRPFLQYAWRVPKSPSQGNSVIFGALAPDTLNGLPADDLQWNAEVPIQVAVGDPAQAVAQAVVAYNVLQRDKPATAVVLAQMSPAEARLFSDSLGVASYNDGRTRESVIFSAADPVEATPDVTITSHYEEREPSAQGRYIPVITPGPIFQKADCLAGDIQRCVAWATFSDDRATLTNTPARMRYPNSKSIPLSANNTFCDNLPVTTWECSVLEKMRKNHDGMDAEIAILEEKDFDYARGEIVPDTPATPEIYTSNQQLKTLWNAGNLTRVSLLGSTILAILNQNQAYQARTFQSLASVRRTQQLRILGIYQDGHEYFVRGIGSKQDAPLVPTAFYSVATSDNLANTTSDYLALANLDRNPPEVFRHVHKTALISDLATAPLPHGLPSPTLVQVAQLEPAYRIAITKDDRKNAAPSVAPSSFSRSYRGLFGDNVSLNNPRLSQFEPFWHIAVQQVSVGYSFAHPSQSDANIGANLGGITNPNVSSPHSDTFTAVANGRIEYYLKRSKCAFCLSDVGVDGQFNLTHNVLGATTVYTTQNPQPVTTLMTPVPTTTVTDPSNTIFGSPFLDFQTRALKVWKPLVLRPGVVTSNILTYTQYLGSAGPSTPPPVGTVTPAVDFTLTVKRSETLGGNAGTRFEWNDYKYVEFGYAWQRSLNVLSAVSVSGITPCYLTNAMTLADCTQKLNSNYGPLSASYSSYTQNGGGYILGTWTKPFPKNPFPDGYSTSYLRRTLFLYQGTVFGDFFAYRKAASATTLTRYAFDMSNSLQFTLPANFSFGPTYNVYFFQANFHGEGASLHRHSLGAQVNYSFDWHTGLPASKTLLGKVQ